MISVLVPIYNKAENELLRCFESILKQTYRNFELIITDDGSAPELAKFLDEYTEHNKLRCEGGVHCFHYSNGGVWEARNRGQEKASGEWIMHVNADDFINPLTLEYALKVANEHENVDMVYWGFWNTAWPPYMSKECGGSRLYSKPTIDVFHIRKDVIMATPFCDVTCMVRKEKAHTFKPHLPGAEAVRQVEVIADCRAIFFLDEILYNYVTSSNTLSSKVDINWCIATIKDFKEALVSYNFKVVNEYLIAYAIDVVHRAAECDFSIYRNLDKSIISDVLRSTTREEMRALTGKKKIICLLFKSRQFFVLGILLKMARTFNKKGNNLAMDETNTSIAQNDKYSKLGTFRPLVSVIIPVSDYSKCLRETISSALVQTYDNIEVVAVSGSSNKNIIKIIKSYGNGIRHVIDDSGNIAAYINSGISEIRGDYFAFLMPNNMFYPQKVEREIECLASLTDRSTVVLSSYEVINEKNESIFISRPDQIIAEYPERERSRSFHVLYSTMHDSCLYPRSCILDVGVMNGSLQIAYGQEYLGRAISKYGSKLINETLFIIRKGEDSKSYRSNIEYSQLAISIIESLSDKDISLMWSNKIDFYLSIRIFLNGVGRTIAMEYADVMCQSLGIESIHAQLTPISGDVGVGEQRVSVCRRVLRSINEQGILKTVVRIVKKIFSYKL